MCLVMSKPKTCGDAITTFAHTNNSVFDASYYYSNPKTQLFTPTRCNTTYVPFLVDKITKLPAPPAMQSLLSRLGRHVGR
jgi:hypothetical protein